MLAIRTERCCVELGKLSTQTFFAVYSHYLTIETDFFPWQLGGTGEFWNMYSNMPYYTQVPGLHLFSLIQIGYFAGDLLDTVVFATKDSNYWEMFFHHLCSLALVTGMTFLGQQRVGAIVVVIHATTDILIHSARLLSNTVYSAATGAVFVAALLLWIYYRNYALVILLKVSWESSVRFDPGFECLHFLTQILCCFQTFLVIMHVYWTFAMVKMLRKYYKGG